MESEEKQVILILKTIKKTGNCLLQQRTGNQLFIKQFYKSFYNPNFNLQNIKSYKQMNEIRMKLKKLFDDQRGVI